MRRRRITNHEIFSKLLHRCLREDSLSFKMNFVEPYEAKCILELTEDAFPNKLIHNIDYKESKITLCNDSTIKLVTINEKK